MHCPSCGVSNSDRDSVCARCGKPLSAGAGQARWAPSQAALNATDAASESGIAYAGFWRRFGAMVIDWLLLWVAVTAISFVAGLAMATGAVGSGAVATTALISLAFWLLVPWLYFSLMESSAQQATLGKLAVGVKVTDLAGQHIGFGRATGRYWGKVISQMIMYVGYLMAAFTARRQALHDMMAGTLVIYRNPSPAALAAATTARPMAGWVIALIILACLVPVFGILAAISIPAYKTYTVRAQISEGLGFADGARIAVAESYIASGNWPSNNAGAGLPGPEQLTSKYVQSITVGANGVITIALGNEIDRAVTAGQTIVYTPALSPENDVVWTCGSRALVGEATPSTTPTAGTLPTRFLPANCRP